MQTKKLNRFKSSLNLQDEASLSHDNLVFDQTIPSDKLDECIIDVMSENQSFNCSFEELEHNFCRITHRHNNKFDE
jgi:hypothetical protein